LSNLTFKKERIAGVVEVDYKLAEGKPEVGVEYVLVVEVGVGTRLRKYSEFPIALEEKGHLRHGARGLGTTVESVAAYIARKAKAKPDAPPARGPSLDKISGVIKIGQDQSAAKRPPTIVELAGAGAVGKLFAIANPKVEEGDGQRKGFSVEFQTQGQPSPTARYFWVIQPATGSPAQFDVTLSVRRNKSGRGKFSVVPRGDIDLKGPIEMRIETPKGTSALRGPREVISNTVKTEPKSPS